MMKWLLIRGYNISHSVYNITAKLPLLITLKKGKQRSRLLLCFGLFLLLILFLTYSIFPERDKRYMYLHDEKEALLDWFTDRVPINETLASEGVPIFLKSDYPRHRIVEFYAHWCPHCKKFRPKYIEFSHRLQNLIKRLKLDLEIDVVAVSCVPHRKTCNKFKVHKYPSFKLFHAHSMNTTILRAQDLENPRNILKKIGIQVNEDSPEMDNFNPTSTSTSELTVRWALSQVEAFVRYRPPHFIDRSKQEIFRDAHLSLEFLIEHGVLTSLHSFSHSKKGPLITTFKNFLEILQKTVPQACSMYALIRDLLQQFDKIATGTDAEFLDIMKPHKLELDWSPACRQHESGFTCGLWTLFHISSVGLVKWNQLHAQNFDLILSCRKASDTLRDVIEFFFQCEVCSDHFLFEYDSCAYDRCGRFQFQTKKGSRTDEWKEYPLWLYETHNGVNARLRTERIKAKETEHTTASEVLWPPENKCEKCWESEGVWNETEVYQWLCFQYWIEDKNEPAVLQSKFSPELRKQNFKQQSVVVSFICMFALVSGNVILRRKKKFDHKGYHKKVDLPLIL